MEGMVVPESSHDFMELVRENGTLLVRGTASPNHDVYTSACPRFFSDNQLGEYEEHNHEFGGGGGSNKPDGDCNSQLQQTPTSFCLPSRFTGNNNPLPTNIDFSKTGSTGSHGGEVKRMNFSHFRGFNSVMVDTHNGQGIGSGHNRLSPTKVMGMDNKLSKRPSCWEAGEQPQPQPIHVGAGALMVGSRDSLVPDEHSQAVGNSFVEDDFVRECALEDDHQVPGSDSSMELSGTAPSNSKRRRFDQPESRYHDEDQEEEEEEMADQKRRTSRHSRVRNGTRRSRYSGNHNLSEKKRRDRINQRMLALQELLPNCDKVDKVSILDEAIEYMKSLQLQLQLQFQFHLQIMSTGSRIFSSPTAMLPAGIHQLPLPYMYQFPLASAGMGPAGFAQGQVHQLPLPGPGSAVALAGGFQPMYMPVIGGNQRLRSLVHGVDFLRATAAMTPQLGLSAATSGPNDAQKQARS
ncbi:hypothetical protein SAY86_010924 [Trapa natans]|uniref:BHLH domain-containing protein n=1 Tax=Trapa natans TaxID=22666 RepID=A0AAN7LJ97_TRANT|nr:hypothetical protein SAY86_010924 [Trapa natans]